MTALTSISCAFSRRSKANAPNKQYSTTMVTSNTCRNRHVNIFHAQQTRVVHRFGVSSKSTSINMVSEKQKPNLQPRRIISKRDRFSEHVASLLESDTRSRVSTKSIRREKNKLFAARTTIETRNNAVTATLNYGMIIAAEAVQRSVIAKQPAGRRSRNKMVHLSGHLSGPPSRLAKTACLNLEPFPSL